MESSGQRERHCVAALAQPGELRLDHSALSSAAGGVDVPTTPAGAMIVRTYGIICTNCNGMPCVPWRSWDRWRGAASAVGARVLHPQPAMVSFKIPAQTAGGRAHDHTRDV